MEKEIRNISREVLSPLATFETVFRTRPKSASASWQDLYILLLKHLRKNNYETLYINIILYTDSCFMLF